ncbi:hypothetical protein NF212_16085 [Parasalinivibrio latis]|uniref:hypothetical protein n=1 Tax=Parasalinivibrio latis TaxID=2952610 RepID=UPI0030E0E80F
MNQPWFAVFLGEDQKPLRAESGEPYSLMIAEDVADETTVVSDAAVFIGADRVQGNVITRGEQSFMLVPAQELAAL